MPGIFPGLLVAVVEIVRISSGAVLVDDFEDGVIDPAKWTTSLNDPGLQIEEADGVFRVFGTTADTLGTGNPHVGILSQYTMHDNPANAVAVAALRVRDLTPAEPGDYLEYWVHLCNWSPDRNTTVCLKWSPSAQYRWWDRVRTEAGTEYVPPSLPLFGDETSSFRTCQVEVLDGNTTASMFDGGTWLTVGATTPNPGLVNKRLELKAVVYPRNHPVLAEWDDARIFEHPQSAPILFAVESSAHSVALFHEGALVDSAGAVGVIVEVHLDLRAPIPYDLDVRLYENGVELGSAPLPAAGVVGAYPGDVYEITSSPVAAPESVTVGSWGSVKARYRK